MGKKYLTLSKTTRTSERKNKQNVSADLLILVREEIGDQFKNINDEAQIN